MPHFGLLRCRARVAAVRPAPESAVTAAAAPAVSGVVAARPDRGTYAGPTRAAAAVLAGFMAVQVPGLRATEAVGVPAVRVITQVVIDMSPVAAACGAVITGFPRIAIPNVKVISFAAHASSLVARRSRLTGMRPLPERRVQQSREPADVKRYLLGHVFTGWTAHAASGVRQAHQCRERKKKRGGSTRNSDRLRPHRPGIHRIRLPSQRARGLA